MVTTGVTTMHLTLEEAIHGIPLNQLFAMVACHAYSNGMEPANGGYEDREFERELARIKQSAKQGLQEKAKFTDHDQRGNQRGKKTKRRPDQK